MTEPVCQGGKRKSPPKQSIDRFADELVALSRDVACAANENEIVSALARSIRCLFVGRSFCIRIIDPRSYSITSVSMNGALTCSPDSSSGANRELLALRRRSAQEAGLDIAALLQSPVKLTDEEPLVFEDSEQGLAVPLSASGRLLGILNLEYSEVSNTELERDKKLLILIANIVAMAINQLRHGNSSHKEIEWRIVQAEKLASLGQLAAGVAHEIKNPLSAITMYSDALLQLAQARSAHSNQSGELEKLLRIKESADRILRIARDLTSYARPTFNRTEEVDLHDTVEEAVRYCEHALRQCSATVYRSYSTLPKIRGVRANLVQVFVNIFINACHALPKDGGSVNVSTWPRENGAEVKIADTGSGICDEDLPRIFEPFFSTKPEGSGTGLGLAIVHNIVQKHGGTIHVTSAKGQGTTFSIWLPVQAEMTDQAGC